MLLLLTFIITVLTFGLLLGSILYLTKDETKKPSKSVIFSEDKPVTPKAKVGDYVLDYGNLKEILRITKNGSQYSFGVSHYCNFYRMSDSKENSHTYLGQIKEVINEVTDSLSDIANIAESAEIYLKLNYKKNPIKFKVEIDTPTEYYDLVNYKIESNKLKKTLKSTEGEIRDCYILESSKSGISGAIYFYEREKGISINPDHVLEASVKYNYRKGKVTETVTTYETELDKYTQN